jgi:predicted MPP superfamily phosphohydrolase
MTSTTFLVDSDLHFTNQIRSYKKNHVEKIINLCQNQNINALICPGDLTNNGWDGANMCGWYYGGKQDQLTPLKEQYVKPLEYYLPVYLCAGNHDYYVPRPYIVHPVLKYIREKHGAQRYSFDINDLHFICLDRYPDKESMKFLKRDLSEHQNKNIIIFFHYNFTGEMSDWWSNKTKDKFYDAIQGYNIVALLVGHHHISIYTQWRGYKVIMGAAGAFAKCTYKDGDLKVEFIS